MGVRIYYEDVSGEWKPTKKGITLTADLFPELKKAVTLLEEGLGEEATAAEQPASPETESAE
ncbi:MAG: transcriptional coactivator p15/PC4 family protein [bacterium]